jgi:hypothetical protein
MASMLQTYAFCWVKDIIALNTEGLLRGVELGHVAEFVIA